MTWTIANQLTVSRIFFSAIFFVLVGFYTPDSEYRTWIMGAGFVLYVIAGITDFLDGYFARKLNQVSAFGRIVDPIVDKVLVVGAFAMFAGPDYVMCDKLPMIDETLPHWLTGGMSSTVQPWMVVVLLAREFIISGLRGYCESQGLKFPAIHIGKLKMLTQCIALGAILFCIAWTPQTAWTMWVKISMVWASMIITVISGLVYVQKGIGLLRAANG